MNAAIVLLKTRLDEQNRLIEEKSRRERALVGDFSSRMQDILSQTPSFPTDVKVPAMPVIEEPIFEKPEPMYKVELESSIKMPSKMDEIVPMIELALDHGDDTDKIRHSLVSSGYSKSDIEQAFSMLKIK